MTPEDDQGNDHHSNKPDTSSQHSSSDQSEQIPRQETETVEIPTVHSRAKFRPRMQYQRAPTPHNRRIDPSQRARDSTHNSSFLDKRVARRQDSTSLGVKQTLVDIKHSARPRKSSVASQGASSSGGRRTGKIVAQIHQQKPKKLILNEPLADVPRRPIAATDQSRSIRPTMSGSLLTSSRHAPNHSPSSSKPTKSVQGTFLSSSSKSRHRNQPPVPLANNWTGKNSHRE